MAWSELFSTWTGWLSIFTIVFVVVIAFFLLSYARRKIEEDGKAASSHTDNSGETA